MSKNTKFDNLLNLDVYTNDKKLREKLFLDSLNETYKHHYENCEPYRRFCDRRGFNNRIIFKELEEIPALPVQAFKQYGDYLISSSNKKRSNLILQSSATSGRPSSVSIDKITARRQVQTMSRVLVNFLGEKKRPFIIVDADPRNASRASMGARVAATSGFLNFSKKQTYILKESPSGNLTLDESMLIDELKKLSESGESPVIFGFTYVLFESILENPEKYSNFNLGNDASLIHIGGWKKLENRKVSKSNFNDLVNSFFGIPQQNIFDIFGFTEQMGIIYPSSGLNDKTTSVFGDVLVRDPSNYKILDHGEEGLLQFISPMPYSYPGHSIITDDLGVITGENYTNDGFSGKTFKVTGRAKNAEVRGCGDIMSTYVKVGSNANKNVTKSKPVLLFNGQPSTNPKSYLLPLSTEKLPEINRIYELENSLRSSRSRLDEYSVDELISYMSAVSKTWLDEKSELSNFKQHGLSFLTNWLDSANLRMMADQGLNGQRGILDSFAVDKNNEFRKLRAVPRGLVSHWLAGNVPLLGMLALAQSIITKNANILKAPSKNTGVLALLLKSMSDFDLKLPTGKVIKGRDITDSIALIHFERENRIAAEDLSKIADVRVAWGGREAIESVLTLPRKHTCEDVIFGPKLSYMVIGKESLHKELNINKLLRRVATDCSVFDQYACASPHTIFVENGGDISPKKFAEMLATNMEKTSKRIPKDPADAGTVGNINSMRMLYEFTEELWTSNDSTWTVLFDQRGVEGLVDPTYSRVITVRAIDNILDAAEFAHNDIQTVGVALEPEKKALFVDKAAQNGACRFPDIGRMTHFDSPWDGMFLISRLVKFVPLEGPF